MTIKLELPRGSIGAVLGIVQYLLLSQKFQLQHVSIVITRMQFLQEMVVSIILQVWIDTLYERSNINQKPLLIIALMKLCILILLEIILFVTYEYLPVRILWNRPVWMEKRNISQLHTNVQMVVVMERVYHQISVLPYVPLSTNSQISVHLILVVVDAELMISILFPRLMHARKPKIILYYQLSPLLLFLQLLQLLEFLLLSQQISHQ